ncbi:putative ferric-chelate reductase 1 [Amphibalanus amphitrite]|uniref:Putative ferric-chelate reductase 1 n=1 Tax=Amphibalanus amphitrite TaxID=1232801 RepID=A0A6A4VZ62_AMPAM|nr:putative ferric-chelate reductase 1 [Amphibalanus amphitrite]
MRGRVARLLALAAALAVCGAYQRGAPSTACGEMTPGHGPPAQPTPMPYNITLSSTVIKAGRSCRSRGFFAQVRYADDPDSSPALGRFMTRQHTTVSCQPGEENGISHADNKVKESVTLLWLSPPDLDRDVLFRVSVVQEYSTFWVGHDTPVIRVLREARPEEPAVEVPPVPTRGPRVEEPAAVPAVPAEPAEENTPAPCTEDCDGAAADGDGGALASVYDGCGRSVGCFADADGCVESRSCEVLVTYALRPDGRYQLQLYGGHQAPGYLAVGFSTDQFMGDDDVIYCADDGAGGFAVKHAYNNAVPKRAVVVEPESEEGGLVSDVRTEYRDGFLRCEFSHAARFTVDRRPVDLSSSDLHLMVASGPAHAGGPGYHSVRRASGGPVQLQSRAAAAGQSSLLFRLHGALMIGAWIGTASTGMLLARYYKQTWAGRKLAGLDLWFQGHRTLMMLTVLLAIGGLVCIVLQLGGWTSTPLLGAPGASPHPLLGVLCVALALLQPLMAMCRCHPGAPRRAIFNWLHWMVGSAAHILGVAAVFFAVELPAAKLPDWTYWVLAAFVVFHVLTHFILSLAQCCSDRAMRSDKGRGGEAYNMRDMGMNSYHVYQADRPQEAPGSTLRRTVLGIYIVINMLFVALLVCMVVLAPADKWLDAIM